MKLLFVCNQNKNRSKTAELLFNNKYNTKSAGLFTNKPLTEKEMKWADSIIVMEDFQRTEIAKRFPKTYLQKRILSLNIPDIYKFNDIKLKKELKNKIVDLI